MMSVRDDDRLTPSVMPRAAHAWGVASLPQGMPPERVILSLPEIVVERPWADRDRGLEFLEPNPDGA